MGSKAFLLLALFAAIVLLVSSNVSAASTEGAETNAVEDATHPNDNGGYGGGRGGYGGGRGGYGGGGRGGGGGGGGYGRGRCRYGCCGRGYYRERCRCCAYSGQAVDADFVPEENHN